MPWIGAAIGAGASLLGGAMAGSSAEDAARTSAAAQTEAARIAAEAQKFRPVGVTTAFGGSQFGFSPEGYLSSAGYTLSPELARQRDLFLSQAGTQGLGLAEQAGTAGQGLFNLGQGYLAQSPEAAAQQWMASQQAALAPGQERQLAGIRNQQQQLGRAGLSVGATTAGGMGASNPELQAYYNSLAQTNLGLAGQAQQQGREQTQFGQGLLTGGLGLTSAGYDPYKTMFGLGQSLESAGQGALDIGSALGGRAATAGANVGQTLLQGGMGAARTMQEANAYNPYATALTGLGQNQQLTSGLAGLFGPPAASPWSSGGTGFGTGSMWANQDYGQYI